MVNLSTLTQYPNLQLATSNPMPKVPRTILILFIGLLPLLHGCKKNSNTPQSSIVFNGHTYLGAISTCNNSGQTYFTGKEGNLDTLNAAIYFPVHSGTAVFDSATSFGCDSCTSVIITLISNGDLFQYYGAGSLTVNYTATLFTGTFKNYYNLIVNTGSKPPFLAAQAQATFYCH